MLKNWVVELLITLLFISMKPSVIITILHLLLLIGIVFFNIRNKTFEITVVKFSKINIGKKNTIILSIIGYAIFVVTCNYLPSYLNENNLIINISKTFLEYEYVMFLANFLFFCSSYLNKVNKDTHIITSNRILHYLIWISIGANFITEQIDFSTWQSVTIIICAGLLNFLFLILEIKSIDAEKNKSDKFDLIPYRPTNSSEELFPKHKEQAKDIANVIKNSSTEPFSICLSGEWGTGKTSVINGVIDILKKDPENGCNYDFIYINALELEDKQAVLKYLMGQIRDKLKSKGAYIGINSEYSEFVSSTTGTITTKEIGTLFQNLLSNAEDYRSQKEQLEEIIKRSYKDGKLVVIVDDIERCDEKTAREYLFLIKEVATMKNCISIFITDYEMLEFIVSKDTASNSSTDFLNKFFNYRINLLDETPNDILNYYDSFFNEKDPAFEDIYRIICKSPKTWYDEIIVAMNAKIKLEKDKHKKIHLSDEKQKAYDKKIEELEECLVLFEKLMKKPRNIAKFYNVFRNHAHQCAKLFFSLPSPSSEVTQYINTRNIGQILYVLSFAEVCMPFEYQHLVDQGAIYAEHPYFGLSPIKNVERRLLISLYEGLVFGEYFEFIKPTPYIKEDIRKFTNTFMKSKSMLGQLINTFTTQEDIWIQAINNSDEQKIYAYWNEMILMVLQKTPNEATETTNSWRNQTFKTLLEFAEKQVKLGKWTTDKVFSIFESNTHADRLLATGTGLMQIFWNHINGSKVYKKPSEKFIEELLYFSCHYSYNRIGSTYRLALYLLPIDTDTNKLQDLLLNPNGTYIDNISSLLKEFEQLIPDLSFRSDDWYENFQMLTSHINNFLNKQELSTYGDVKEEIVHMMDSADELSSLDSIMNWCKIKKTSNNFETYFEIDTDNLEDIISRFEKLFSTSDLNGKTQRNVEKRFSEFFRNLQNNESLKITEEQITRMHALISKFVEISGYSSLPYRRTLIDIAKKEREDKQ